MNAVATEERVRGDFSGNASIEYLGGKAVFFRDGEGYRMELTRASNASAVRDPPDDRLAVLFSTTSASWSRGPLPQIMSIFRPTTCCRLDTGWIAENGYRSYIVWPEVPDDQRFDPFAPPAGEADNLNPLDIFYATACNMCHTTFPLAESICRKPDKIAIHAPARLHWHLAGYIENQHAELWPSAEHALSVPQAQIDEILERMGGPGCPPARHDAGNQLRGVPSGV